VPPIYLDHNATSPLRPEARDAMLPWLAGRPANPSSVHRFGHSARMAVETARAQVAALMGADPEMVVLTGGGTEANNLAIYGAALRPGASGQRIVTSAIEHPSVLQVCAALEARGFDVARVRPDRRGAVDPEAILDAAGPGTVLVSLMLANNETGVLQEVGDLARALRPRGIPLHTDAVQATGRIPVDVEHLGVDLLSIAAHKLGGPLGAGALFVRRGLVLEAHLRGGGQEMNRRPGTENVAAIAGFGAAARAAAADRPLAAARLGGLRDRLERAIVEAGIGAAVNGGGAPRLPNTSSLAFEGATGEGLVIGLDLEGYAVSAGSACSAGTIRRSHVLDAMGLGDAAGCSIRVSFGPENTEADADGLVEAIRRVLERARQAVAGAAGRERA
jgi:cysteine desulfurase